MKNTYEFVRGGQDVGKKERRHRRAWRWKESTILGEQGEVRQPGCVMGSRVGDEIRVSLQGCYMLFLSLGNGEPLEDFNDHQGPGLTGLWKGHIGAV